MGYKIVLALVLFACFWLTDGCNRFNQQCRDACSGNAKCHIEDPRCKHTRGRRQNGSVVKNGTNYSVTLNADPCSFNTYDTNQDGEISKREFRTLLGNNEETDALFTDLNKMTDGADSVIKPGEFFTMAHQIITECIDSNK